MLKLTNIGKIKIGAVRGNKPISLDKLYIRTLSKEGEENFLAFPETDEKGYSTIRVTLPFHKPELNFDVNYTSFAIIDGKEYVIKAKSEGKEVVATPYRDSALPIYRLGKLSDETKEKYGLKLSGVLKVHIPEISEFGETFTFNTWSINSIMAIQNQLESIYSATGYLAGIPLFLRTVKKDSEEGTFIFVSLGLDVKGGLYGKKMLKILERIKVAENTIIKNIDADYEQTKSLTEKSIERMMALPRNKKITLVDIDPEDDIKKAEAKPPKTNKREQKTVASKKISLDLKKEINKILAEKFDKPIPTSSRKIYTILNKLYAALDYNDEKMLKTIRSFTSVPNAVSIMETINKITAKNKE